MRTPIDLYWRPGCGYCARLRGQLDRAGIDRVEHNIWDDPTAAATVRAHAGGNETVPTVLVGEHALVNPSFRQVARAAGIDIPHGRGSRTWVWLVVTGLLWVLLVHYKSTATWHLAPLLVTLAWPLFGRLTGSGRTELLLGTAMGALAAGGLTWWFHTADRLAGPTLIGTAVWHEALVLTAVGAITGAALALTTSPHLTTKE